ncbi:MAG: SAM-dependent methyltransferase, partial [Alphaproteobacteria bacterium]
LRDALRPQGRAALQVITIEDAAFDAYRKSADFIQTYIFPGGMLPSATAFLDSARRAGLSLINQARFGTHYARTLGEWRQRFRAAWEGRLLPKGFDERFRRIWDYYLGYCEGGFRAGGIDVMQVALVRP